jgi:hypothetical protein
MSAMTGCWQQQASGARLACGSLAAAVRIDDSSAALVVERWRGRPVNGLSLLSYFGPSLRLEPFLVSDMYVRGSDFVATFAESGPQKIAPQLYWRAMAIEQHDAVKVELVVSVKTDVLDSQPVSRVHSLISVGAEVWRTPSLAKPEFEIVKSPDERAATLTYTAEQSRDELFLFRLPEHGMSFAELVHPTDFVSAQIAIDRQPPYSLLMSLFPESLERGVIRRARVSGWFLPSANDQEVAVELARQFVNEPLPLTA